MIAFCALAFALVGPPCAAPPGPEVTLQYDFTDRWKCAHRLDGGGFPRSNSKTSAVGPKKMTKMLDAGIEPEMAPALSKAKSTSTYEVYKP